MTSEYSGPLPIVRNASEALSILLLIQLGLEISESNPMPADMMNECHTIRERIREAFPGEYRFAIEMIDRLSQKDQVKDSK